MARGKQTTKRKASKKEEEEEKEEEAIVATTTTKASSSTVGNGVDKEEPPKKKAKATTRPKRGKAAAASSSDVAAADDDADVDADDAAPPPSPSPPPTQDDAPAPVAAAAATKSKKKAVASKPKKKEAVSKPKKEADSKPKKETEYFEEKRNMEDLWKDVFPVGTEWDQLDAVYKYNWDFSNLENAFEEGGKLCGEKVYLFGSTEPQLVSLKGEEGKVVCIPVVVAVVSPFPPSDKIGINSVQREAEEIIPMKQMKMDWVPYIPWENRDNQVERLKSQIFILSCTQRRASLRHMKIERLKKYEYCLPYFYQPMKEDEFEQSTVVDIMYPAEPPVICDFDWDMDDLEEFVDEKVEDESITEDQKDAFKEFIKEKVREAKKSNREAREARKKAVEEMSAEMKDALNKMRFYKFYPVESPDTPDVSKVKSPFINRYYGKAHEVL